MFVYYKFIYTNKCFDCPKEEITMTTVTHRKRYRVKSRLRFTLFIVITLLLLITVCTTVLGLNNATGSTKQQYIQVEVQAGDTLWSLADEYMADDCDPRESVHMISKSNDISASELYPGQIIKIPVDEV